MTTQFSVDAQLGADLLDSRYHVAQLLPGRPASRLAEPAVGSESQSIRWSVLKAKFYALDNVVDRFNVVTLDVDNSYSNVCFLSNLADNFDFGKLAARHFHMDFIHRKVKKIGKHWRVTPRANRMAFEVSKAKMR